MSCEHPDYDDYFERCVDCGAEAWRVIADSFKGKLQALYAEAQAAVGITSGDITPEQSMDLAKAEETLAVVVGHWMESNMGREA